MSAPTDDDAWRTIFGHEQPYDQQVDGIETALETINDGGYLALEGACGTGKTMLALTAATHLVRSSETPFQRVLVLTSVKQQLQQFEADLQTINEGLPDDWDPVSGLTLVGKADVCSYAREGAAGIDSGNVYTECERLRDNTRGLTGEDGTTSAGALVDEARRQQIGLDSAPQGSAAATYLETAGEAAPYDRTLPEHEDVEFCPFYAQYLSDLPDDGDRSEAVPFDPTGAGLIDPEALVARSVRHGTCPHSVMGAALEQVEVVIGNYYHAFDPQTSAAFTEGLVDESTIVVCDEAHMLEPRVRDLVSDGVADSTLREAEGELTRVLQPLQAGERRTEGGPDASLVRAELQESDLSQHDLERTQEFLRALREELARRAVEFLDRERPGWDQPDHQATDAEIPLRAPDRFEPDALTEWAETEGFEREWTRAEAVGAFVGRVLNEAADEERQRSAPSAGRTLAAWARCDHERYFRSIELEARYDDTAPGDSWRRRYAASLSLYNCVPGDAIGERLAEFGGGILMSATLAPFQAFRTVTGLDALEADGRPVETRQYDLAFPPENRASFAVAAPKFTYDNRGPTPDPDEQPEGVRRTYVDAIEAIAKRPGNVLVGMPSYAEAAWAAGVLADRIDKPVLLDEASDDATTQALKDDFFDGDGKVLVTSLRGTLTEGVDYSGDRLSAAVVCGVPIVNTARPRTEAVRSAYDRVFGDPDESPGFEYALTIPAVRKARQAIGRVIRGPEEVGVRAFVDERYARDSWNSVQSYIPEEFQAVSPDMLDLGLERFWDRHERPK